MLQKRSGATLHVRSFIHGLLAPSLLLGACRLILGPMAHAAPSADSPQDTATPPAVAANAPEAAVASRQETAPENALQEVTVEAQRTTEAVARLAQQQAPNIINIETYNQIKQLPDITTAEALERIPGISRETDEGEARYINIRGLDADLNSTTFDGVQLLPTNNASAFGGYRAVALDLIPIGIVGAITATDTNLPSQTAEALGGTIDITPKTPPLTGKPFLEGRVGSGYEPLGGTPIIDLQVSGGTRFGGAGTPAGGVSAHSDSPFSVVGTLAYYEDKRGINDAEPAYINYDANGNVLTGPLYHAINNLQQRDYELHRKRYAWGADFGYQPDAGDEYHLRAFQTGYGEDYRRQFFNITPDGTPTVNAAGQIVDTLNNPGALQDAFRDEREVDKESLYMATAKSTFSGGQILDYRAAFVRATWHKPYDFNSTFNYVNPGAGSSTIIYSPTGAGHTPNYTISGAPGYLDAINYPQLSSFINSYAYNYDQEWTFAGDFDMPVTWLGGTIEDLKMGVSAQLRKKEETASNFSVFPASPVPSLTQAATGTPAESYYDGQYMNPPDIRPGYLQSVLGPGTAAASDLQTDDQQYLLANENIYAAYLQYHVRWDRFGIVGGVRMENTHETLNAFASEVLKGNATPTEVPIERTHGYTDVFPGIQARFQIRPDLVARASWSSTLARPGFNQLSPSASIDFNSDIITIGNPNLKPTYANSFDVDIEQYLPDAGVLSLGIFDKQIRDYIVADSSGATITHFPGFTDPLRTYSFRNASGSYDRGIMLNYEQKLTFLPGLLSGLGINGNYTYIDSRFEIRPGQYARLPSSSKNTWNASLFYQRDGLLVRVAMYGVSADLFAIGADPSTDVYNAAATYLDLGSSYAITRNWQVYFNAKNLLDTPHTFWEGSLDRPIQREFYGVTYQAGFRVDY